MFGSILVLTGIIGPFLKISQHLFSIFASLTAERRIAGRSLCIPESLVMSLKGIMIATLYPGPGKLQFLGV